MLTVAIISLFVLIILLSIGVPLPFCFGGALLFICTFSDLATMKGMMVWGFEQMINPVLLCIPLFVFAGNLMSESGIADALLRFVNLLVTRIRGGLGLVAVITCAIIGAISGSGMTGVAAIGPLLIPRMEANGYPRPYTTALLCSSSVLGLLIPPSINMIIYGWVTGTSILACFLATLLPGILLIAIFGVINYIWVGRFKIVTEQLTTKEIVQRLPKYTFTALPALAMPLIILGGIYGGIMTPTESAALACVYCIPVGLYYYKGLTAKSISYAGMSSITAVGSIMIMIFYSLILSQQFVFGQVPQQITQAIFEITNNKYLLLFLINILLFIVGMIVNDVTGIILTAPLLLPLVKALGIDPVHFAAIMGVNLAMGCITPPYASILYFSMRIGRVQFVQVLRPLAVFILCAYMPVCFITTFFEPLSMALPRWLGLV